MTARTHDLAAITGFGIILVNASDHHYTLATILLSILANQIGGIAPDIDQPTAPLWRNLPIAKFFGKAFGNLIGGHRFLTHSVIGLAIFAFAANLLLTFLKPILGSVDVHFVWLAFMVGMLSHLVMDTFTKEGVPWLLPLPFKFGLPPIKKLRVTTGKFGERCWFAAILFFDIGYCWLYYPTLRLLLKNIIN